MQRSYALLIPRRPFMRLVREIVSSMQPDARLQASAVTALQEACEAYLVRTTRPGGI